MANNAPTVAAERMDDLAAELDHRGFSAQVRAANGKLRVSIQNRLISQLAEVVYAAPDGDGAWWLWWPWDDKIAPISDVGKAALKIAYVLTPA
jgi:hypothetical protein